MSNLYITGKYYMIIPLRLYTHMYDFYINLILEVLNFLLVLMLRTEKKKKYSL